MIWFWLEDQSNTVSDIEAELRQAGVWRRLNIRRLSNPDELTEGIIALERSELQGIGLILDVMIAGSQRITCPPQWCGHDKPVFFETEHGYDSGLVYYEQMVLKHPVGNWNKQPPPVVFLTVLNETTVGIPERLERVKKLWAEKRQVSVGQAKVYWISKWEARTNRRLLDTIEEWAHEAN